MVRLSQKPLFDDARLTLAFVALAALAACATPPPGAERVHNAAEVPSLQKREAGRLDRIKVGMSIAEFKTVFPEAYVGGQSGAVVAYELSDAKLYVTDNDMLRQNLLLGFGSPSPHGQKQVLWFYFRGDALVKWGNPQDWP